MIKISTTFKGTIGFIKKSDRLRLENIGVAYVKYAIDHQAYYRVMSSDYPRNSNQYPQLAQASNNAFNVLLDVIKAGQAAKVFNAQQLAHVCWSLVHGVAMLAIDNQFMSNDRTSVVELAQIATKTVSKGISA
ncbi:TetR-like C-terminal domain-containing protein [Pleurocapsa sp. CCALA 161]|uniref:TetR-like C-terminal domain-containing protein n=1 Tax=Pleurocapsa sp. CCALA 161 TaxID=2107688 RepID=UPI001304BE00|nr:TetR-like C-terminal domain-containing protein [Pleurocapsa sp. CCALA 161]